MTQIHTMDVQTVALTNIAPYPNNPRRGDVDLIASSLATNGQYRPVVVQRSTGYVLAGNNTLAAAEQLGWTSLAVQYLDVDEAAARKILAVDNRSSDAADYDPALLAELLADLDDLEGTGYSDEEVDELISSLNTDDPIDLPSTPDPTPTPAPAPAPAPDSDLPPTPDPTHSNEDTPDPTPASDGAPTAPPQPPAEPLQPVAEMILAFTPADRNEAAQLISAARNALDGELKTADIVLRALRTLVAATDARHTPDSTITVNELLRAAS